MAEKTRSIFEEVGTTQKQVATKGMIDAKSSGARGAIRTWLIVIFALVALMIAIGGLTRLTDSGLSITEWKPVTGALPPMSAEAWDVEFEKYKQIPEYQLQNKGMSLSEFKTIFWWEWGHRQLGRVIGLVWAAGFAFFAITRKIPTGWTGRLLLLGALGGLQGFIGWWMVSSGLEGSRLDVASYRLATHLGLAFVIFGFLTWYILALSRRDDPRLWMLSTILLAFAFVQILLGALVAGIDAGRDYIDWPLMAGGFFPRYILFGFGIFVWWRARASAVTSTKFAFNLILAMLFLQMLLGIVTVMSSAPWHLAIMHQIGAVVLWVLILRARYLSRYPHKQSIQGAK